MLVLKLGLRGALFIAHIVEMVVQEVSQGVSVFYCFRKCVFFVCSGGVVKNLVSLL